LKNYVNRIVAAVMLVAFCVAYLVWFPHMLYFHEQHHLFLFSMEYVKHMAHYKSIWWVIAEFIAQFNYIPWLGALIISALFSATYLLTADVIKRVTGHRDWLQLSAILPIWMFLKTLVVDTFFDKDIKAMAIVLAVWVIAVIFARFLPWNRRKKAAPTAADADKPAPEAGWKKFVPLAGVVLFFVYFYAGWWMDTGDMEVTNPNTKAQVTFTRAKRADQRVDIRAMIETEHAIKDDRWDDANNILLEWFTLGRRNHLMTYFRSLVLAHRGELCKYLFDVPQSFGVRSLYYPWKADRNQAEYGHYVYQEMGHVNEAHRWMFEAFVGWGETAPIMRNLARYNIAMGRPKVAQRFIDKLKQSLFYRGEAERLEQCLKQGEIPEIHAALKDVPASPARWNNVKELGPEAKFILMNDPDNVAAREYLMAYLLLGNNLERFVENLEEYYPGVNSEDLPKCFREALALVRMHYGTATLARMGYCVDDETDEQFRLYMAEKNKGPRANFSPALKRTYWYYVEHVNPDGQTLYF
jgi:hypothetical protein